MGTANRGQSKATGHGDCEQEPLRGLGLTGDMGTAEGTGAMPGDMVTANRRQSKARGHGDCKHGSLRGQGGTGDVETANRGR